MDVNKFCFLYKTYAYAFIHHAHQSACRFKYFKDCSCKSGFISFILCIAQVVSFASDKISVVEQLKQKRNWLVCNSVLITEDTGAELVLCWLSVRSQKMFLGSCSSSLSSSLPLSWCLCETGSPLTSVRWLQLYCLTDRRAVDLEELSFRNPSTGPESPLKSPPWMEVCLWGLLPE